MLSSNSINLGRPQQKQNKVSRQVPHFKELAAQLGKHSESCQPCTEPRCVCGEGRTGIRPVVIIQLCAFPAPHSLVGDHLYTVSLAPMVPIIDSLGFCPMQYRHAYLLRPSQFHGEPCDSSDKEVEDCVTNQPCRSQARCEGFVCALTGMDGCGDGKRSLKSRT